MTSQDLKVVILPVGLAVSLIFSFAVLQNSFELRKDYNNLKSKSNIMAQTIENHSDQLDRNVETIKQKDIRIRELEAQVPK